PRPDIRDTRATLPLGGKRRTIVRYLHRQSAVRARRDNPKRPALCSFRDPVLYRVFYHWLQNQTGHASAEQFFRNIHADLQAVREAHLLDLKVSLHESHLLRE